MVAAPSDNDEISDGDSMLEAEGDDLSNNINEFSKSGESNDKQLKNNKFKTGCRRSSAAVTVSDGEDINHVLQQKSKLMHCNSGNMSGRYLMTTTIIPSTRSSTLTPTDLNANA